MEGECEDAESAYKQIDQVQPRGEKGLEGVPITELRIQSECVETKLKHIKVQLK